MPRVVELRVQDPVTVPFPVRITGVAWQIAVRPEVGLTEEERLTLPAKLKALMRLTEMEDPVAPKLKLTGLLMDMVTSPTCTTEDAEWDAFPGEPAPVIVTPYVPGVAETRVQDALAVPFAERLVDVAGQVTVRPVVGLTTEANATLPAKLSTLVREMDKDAPLAPELKLTGVPTDIAMSPTWTMEVAESEAVPGEPLPVTVTK